MKPGDRIAPWDGDDYAELYKKFYIEKWPDQVYFRGSFYKQIQDGDYTYFVFVRPGTSFDEHYGKSSLP